MRTRRWLLLGCFGVWACEPRMLMIEDVVVDASVDVVDASTTTIDVFDAAREVAPEAAAEAAVEAATETSVTEGGSSGQRWCAVGTPVEGVVLPAGFCIREYARVPEARTLTVAPNGDLFVGAPSMFLPGGANGGAGAVLVLSDDNKDGVAEQHTFAARLPDVHGIALGGGYLYFTVTTTIFRTPYRDGQRQETAGAREDLRLPARTYMPSYGSHGLALSVGGTLYTSNGTAAGMCGGSEQASIFRAGMGALEPIARGFRNPMYLRCHHTAEVCVASELGEDETIGAKEKILQIRPNTDYGYRCCFGRNSPMSPMCANVTEEERSFPIGDTPFGLDWERGTWPEPYRNALFVAMHGSFYTTPRWRGAGVRFVTTDATTKLPLGQFQEFFSSGPGGHAVDRPSDIAFSSDGRMFIADDLAGRVFWVAPETATIP